MKREMRNAKIKNFVYFLKNFELCYKVVNKVMVIICSNV